MEDSNAAGLKERITQLFTRRSSRRVASDHHFTPDTSGGGGADPTHVVCASCGKPFDSHDPVHLRKQGGRPARVCVQCDAQLGAMNPRRDS